MSGAWAIFDATRTYRYVLGRRWDPALPSVAFIMLNPSTADEHVLDPTVRRCVGFAKAWGYGSLEVGNLFALRSTDPGALQRHGDPIGPGNDEVLVDIQGRAQRTVAAWGNHGALLGRGVAVKNLLAQHGPLDVLDMTGEGMPKHPLYVRGDAQPRRWA